ncbi:class I SAM-dependent methyltransferase [Kitasatospora sp. NPDC089913]|uniref:class I SAM-dependent methyltransferase n=1 Tax=Kitasatospora sp. NPDC089913 TaxID=3364080 RepID=UPI0038245CF0
MNEDSAAVAAYWDAAAAGFDDGPDHGLRAEHVRSAWTARLTAWMPSAPADVLDVGCGTGSLSLLLAEAGHRVTGVDLSPEMVARARRKLFDAGLAGRFLVGDAAAPPTGGAAFDVVLARHLLWTLPEPGAALREWVARLRPGGRLVMVEGRWGSAGPYVPEAARHPWTGGVGAHDLATAVRPLVAELRIEQLGDAPDLWGKPVDDERYALIARI